MTPNWQSDHYSSRAATQRDLDKQKVTRNFIGFNTEKTKPCTLGGIMPCIDGGGDRLSRQQFCREGREGAGGQVVHQSQCALVAAKANCVEGCIRKSIPSSQRQVIISLCIAYVRTHLKYCVQFWDTLYKREINKL